MLTMNGAHGATARTLAGEYGIGFASRLGRVGASHFDVSSEFAASIQTRELP
jgi:hypothetical protein